MPLRILSFFVQGNTWRIANSPTGYFHRLLTDPPGWQAGLPSEFGDSMVEEVFQQFSCDDASLAPNNLSFKMNFRIGRSDTEGFLFASSEGDPFIIKIPEITLQSLQQVNSWKKLPKLRVARLALEQALELGYPEPEVTVGDPIYNVVKAQLER